MTDNPVCHRKTSSQDTSSERLITMLTTAVGPQLGDLLRDDQVVEVMLNPDGNLWVDRLGTGRECTGLTVCCQDAERIIKLVASGTGAEVNETAPIISAEFPGTGSRFQGLLPPVVTAPVFTIRKKALMIFSLADYVAQGVMTEGQKEVLCRSIIGKKNILITGGTGSGKTTLVNALLNEIALTCDRIVIIEDTLELQCSAPDTVFLRARDGIATMNDLLKATMRLRPDRIVVGEVRGGEALSLLKAWNTGHPGGCATVHANNAMGGLIRLEQLIQEAAVSVSKDLVAEAVDIIVHIERSGSGRVVREVVEVLEAQDGKYRLMTVE
ncbi:P-type conjugative transfer ATPase TrbB [Geomonas anaerohicana]|uniref:P-type conjugative transfer ATPase TrbB n=1 Tax=Geomonas anaerohicana TaxID=2798583 RepID=A0ABS0YC92_9BACT|nr:P-type conjugative transfer ATPase TrbB [Geomonas anaerohicana]MBJ6749922.1 P-type conjugative transfer ATPase TrbB [Geomonas anaerohicana]